MALTRVAIRLVVPAADQSGVAGCEWRPVDFEDELRPFYFGACGFVPTNTGLIALPNAAENGARRSGR